MSGKSVIASVLMLGVLGQGEVFAQPPYQGEVLPTPRTSEAPAPPYQATGFVGHDTHPVSPWLAYHRDCCSGAANGSPILSEVYFISGISIPIGGRIIGDQSDTGWTIGGGGRVLLFNPSLDRAWTVDASLTNSNNNITKPNGTTTLNIIQPNIFGVAQRVNMDVTLREYNRTTVNLAFGRELYLWGNAASCDRQWRVGWDVGGRYGSASAEFREIRHRTDVIGGAFASVHTDILVPWGCCLLIGGFRVESGYTWSDIMQRQSDFIDVNLLFVAGVRF